MANSSSLQIIISGGMSQAIFFVMLLGVTGLTFSYLEYFVSVYNGYKAGRPEYPWPEPVELYWSGIVCFVLIFVRVLLQYKAVGLAYKVISQKYDEQDRLLRAERAVIQWFKAAFYTYSFITGYFICKNAIWFPIYFGGSGKASLFIKDWPYQNHDEAPYLRFYILTELGFHLHALISHLFEPFKKNFIEMVFHHVITVIMILIAFFLNFHAVAALVMFSHDISDIFICITRGFLDTNYKRITLGSYFMIMASWVFTRLFFYISEIVWPVYTGECLKGIDISGTDSFLGLLSSLAILNIFWFYKLSEMGYLYVTKSEYNDTVEGISRTKKQK